METLYFLDISILQGRRLFNMYLNQSNFQIIKPIKHKRFQAFFQVWIAFSVWKYSHTCWIYTGKRFKICGYATWCETCNNFKFYFKIPNTDLINFWFQHFSNTLFNTSNIHVTCSFLKSKNIYWLPVCQTYCTHTYVLAAKKSHCTGINRKHTTSDVTAMQTKKTEKACQKRNNIIMTLY